MTTEKSAIPSGADPDGRPSALLLATAADVAADGTTFVVLSWSPYPEAVGYNLYRRVGGSSRRPALRPINGGGPIEPVRTCPQLTRLVPRKSREWEILASALGSRAARERPASEPVDPCAAFERGLTPEELGILDALASRSLNLRMVRGLAYVDRRVRPDQHYVYDLRGVLGDGSEVRLAVDVAVWAGHGILPDPPSGLVLAAGDRRVLALWNRNPYAHTFAVQRSTNPGGPFQAVNPEPVAFDLDRDLDDQPISPPRPGFLDFQRWDTDGLPISHVVDGGVVVGPDNGTTYYYRVASRDALDRLGGWSPALPATPVRGTPPMAPDELQVSVQSAPPGLALTWRKVTRDVDNHRLPDASQTYFVYRSAGREDLEDLAGLPSRQVGSVVAAPQDPATATLRWTDTDPILLPLYGETTFFYRLACSDPFGNVSAPSAIIGGRVPDTTPPGPTEPDGADGFPDHIRVYWRPNAEPDLVGYLVYRGVCDRGEMYVPGRKQDRPHGTCDLTLVGQVALGDAEAMLAATGQIHFDDFSVPEGSPICYGYWVRAYDVAQNLYDGNGGCPARRDEYVCMRLLEKTPPPAPIVTGLKARSDAVLVEWIASPVQDLRAFHVYRSDAELDPPVFLGCVLTDGTVSANPWPGVRPSCADIPAEPDPLAARGHFLDATAVPHTVYWYRVSALDWLGNESEAGSLVSLPSSSTFTYTRELPVTPAVLPPPLQPPPGCGLEVAWGPTYDAATLEGFVVYRSTAGGPYRQVSPILAGNAFRDDTARRSVDYWYCVQSVDRVGRLSRPSNPVLHRY